MMDDWNDGKQSVWYFQPSIIPVFQYSSIPLLLENNSAIALLNNPHSTNTKRGLINRHSNKFLVY